MPVRRALVLATLLAAAVAPPAQLVAADPGLAVESLTTSSPADLAASLGGTDAVYLGAPAAAGSFSGGSDIVGISEGVVLTSGDVANVPGPNASLRATLSHGLAGDDGLSAITGRPTKDASVLAFDLTPESDTLAIRYVFASEEYLENVNHDNQNFNDVAGIWVDGTRCAGVAVNSINHLTNAQLFVDNADGHLDTEMDGLTDVLTCTASVTPGEPSHVRIAIADGTNDGGDAALFVEGRPVEEEPEGADVSVALTDEPDPVISSGTVRYLATAANAGPEPAAGVGMTVAPSAGEITAASGTGWTCTHTAAQASCSLAGPLAAGGSAPAIEVLVRAPVASEQSTITSTATVSSDGDPNPANDAAQETTQVDAFDSDSASTYCPPGGCVYGTAQQVTTQDNTGNKVFASTGGGGSVSTLREDDTTYRCGRHRNIGTARFGQETDFLPPAGYEDPTNPIKVVTTYHRSTVRKKAKVRICMRKPDPQDPTQVRRFTVRPCKVRGVAKPHPCINRIRTMKNGNLRVIMLMLSPDPQWRR